MSPSNGLSPLGGLFVMYKQILKEVQADATNRLGKALNKHDTLRAERAICAIVEAALPNRRFMPETRVDTIYRGHGGPHVAWKWVAATGMLTLLVHASSARWGSLEVSAFLTYPGLSKKQKLLYRNETTNPAQLPLIVQQALRQVGDL